jgi:hypothetical protein
LRFVAVCLALIGIAAYTAGCCCCGSGIPNTNVLAPDSTTITSSHTPILDAAKTGPQLY